MYQVLLQLLTASDSADLWASTPVKQATVSYNMGAQSWRCLATLVACHVANANCESYSPLENDLKIG